ncbi:MAG: (deoxy)nucleoside triphosphate pyrophosphohydrolase [Pseudomonadota bacterium]
MRRHLHVACAIIILNEKILAAQRSENMTLPLKWEFPGGKIEPGEEPAGCLARELLEELGITVTIDRPLPTATHSYDDFTVTLYPFVCRMAGGEITLHEHKAIVWIEPGRMPELEWAEADLPIIGSFLASHAAGPGGSCQ